MSSSMKLRVQWSKETFLRYSSLRWNAFWNAEEEREYSGDKPPLTVEDIAIWLEGIAAGICYKQTQGKVELQVQVQSIGSSDQKFPMRSPTVDHIKSGDSIIVDALAVSFTPPAREPTEKELHKVRHSLRFDLNDRVVCNLGLRWFSGLVVGTAVPDEAGILSYLVRTDPLPGLPSRAISVPDDHDGVCKQEVCFDPSSELHLIKAAAESCKKLRFAVGDDVVCRIGNGADRLEQWVEGTVSKLWPKLPGELKWDMVAISGQYPEAVPYQVERCKGVSLYCHRDHHTLIRRKGMEPQTRVRGISKRLEVRTTTDGGKEKVDHVTERRKRMAASDAGDSS